MMDRIIAEAESHFTEWGKEQLFQGLGASDAASIARAAHELAHDGNVTAVTCFTLQGRSARLISKIRPGVPIFAFTPIEETYRQLPFLWGVTPHLVPHADSLEAMIHDVDAALVNVVKPGDQVVVICGFPVGAMGAPNMALLHTVGS